MKKLFLLGYSVACIFLITASLVEAQVSNPEALLQQAKQSCETLASQYTDEYFNQDVARAKQVFDAFLSQLSNAEVEKIKIAVQSFSTYYQLTKKIVDLREEKQKHDLTLEDSRKKLEAANYSEEELKNFLVVLKKNDDFKRILSKTRINRDELQPFYLEARYEAENILYALKSKVSKFKIWGLTVTNSTEKEKRIVKADVKWQIENNPHILFEMILEPTKDSSVFLKLDFATPRFYKLALEYGDNSRPREVVARRLYTHFPVCQQIWRTDLTDDKFFQRSSPEVAIKF